MIKKEDDLFIQSLQQPCIESRLQEVLDINANTWNNLKLKGIIPIRGTVGEFLVKAFKHYREQHEVALAKVQLKQDETKSSKKSRLSDTESGLPKIQEAAIIQKIKLDRAREEQIHIINLKERSAVLDKNELLLLCEPVFNNIANILRSAGESDPALQPIVDKCFSSLYTAAERILESCEQDSENFVKEMLNKRVDLTEILENYDNVK